MQALQNWLQQPFSANMSAAQWFLFFGLLMVIAFLWHLILVSVGVTRS